MHSDPSQAAFPADETLHYRVTPCDVADCLAALEHYDWADSSLALGAAVLHEATRTYRDRLTSADHRSRFDALLASTLIPHFPGLQADAGAVFSTLGVAAEERLKGSAAARVLSRWTLSDFGELVRGCASEALYRSLTPRFDVRKTAPSLLQLPCVRWPPSFRIAARSPCAPLTCALCCH